MGFFNGIKGSIMSAKYIIRLDDACPTMDKIKWKRVEYILNKYNIKPIVGVIPNNEDKALFIDKADELFWDKIRKWQTKGWYIALHGYNHILGYTNKYGIIPINSKTEFVELPYDLQLKKIENGLKIFENQNIKTNIWVAPAHTFDFNTLKALKKNNLYFISDGLGIHPFIQYGFNWIPQQLWSFRNMPIGTWTICLHPNTIKEDSFIDLENFIEKNIDNFILVDDLKYKKSFISNYLFSYIYLFLLKIIKVSKNANKK